MGAPLGNQNGAKAKEWEQALKRALARKGNGDYRLALDGVASVVVEKALSGDRDAWQEIGVRLDGKPAQALDLAHSGSIGLTGLLETLPIAKLPGADQKVD